MPQMYRYDHKRGEQVEVVTRHSGPVKDRYGERERARAVERKVRANQQSKDGYGYTRHSHQIHQGMAAHYQRRKGCLTGLILVLLPVALCIGCVVIL